ncbi:MAG: hypothetical protein LBF22_13850 [Deltaproteobacteria bacterium]|jgi:hypothetical protein|nr:hypothetical protein [Deltaproteobacteria bacterium]
MSLFNNPKTIDIIAKNLANPKQLKIGGYCIMKCIIPKIIFGIILFILINLTVGCGIFGGNEDDPPAEVNLPSNQIERAAVQGLVTSYKESTMWQIQNVTPKSMTPMAPSGELLELQDPKEVYCVCLEYEGRYKVTWATAPGSTWEKKVSNILVIKTQGDQYMAMKPMNICNPHC